MTFFTSIERHAFPTTGKPECPHKFLPSLYLSACSHPSFALLPGFIHLAIFLHTRESTRPHPHRSSLRRIRA